MYVLCALVNTKYFQGITMTGHYQKMRCFALTPPGAILIEFKQYACARNLDSR